jgi:hypothetical protein
MTRYLGWIAAMAVGAMCIAPPVIAQDHYPAVQGKLMSPEGVLIKDYPVVVTGMAKDGKSVRTFVTTNADGTFAVFDLPAGTYQIAPAGEPGRSKNFEVELSKWWTGGSVKATTNVGTISVPLGKKY